MQKYNSRQEVPEKYKFDLNDIYPDVESYNKGYEKCAELIDKLSQYKGKMKDPKSIYEFLKLCNETYTLLYRIIIYAYLLNDIDLDNSDNKERVSKAFDLDGKYGIAISFFEPELLELSKDEYEKLFEYEELKEFKSSLDDTYRRKDHILPEEQEIIISKLNNASANYDDLSATMINSLNDYGTVNIDGEEEKITATNISRLLKNKDRSIRKEIYNKYYNVLDQYSALFAALLNGFVKTNITNCQLHNYKDAWDAKVFNTKMPTEAYDALINTTEEHVEVYQKYWDTFKNILGLDELHPYDLGLEVSGSNREYSIEEAQEICLKAVAPLGEEYYNQFKKIFDNKYVDYACYPGKVNGAYSIAGIDFDSRIMMSYNYDLNSISTIIHEGGHNVHHHYVTENNPTQYRDVNSLICEVASLTNECLLSSYLAENGRDDGEKMEAIDNILSVFLANIFSSVREGKIEQDFYNYVKGGNVITKDYMNDLFHKSNEKYYGDKLVIDNYKGLSWILISHYYMNYYLFSYAFSLCVASYVASEILNGNEDMRQRYLEFLKLGSDTEIVDAYNVLGVDITDKKVYERAIEYCDSMIDKLNGLNKEVRYGK